MLVSYFVVAPIKGSIGIGLIYPFLAARLLRR